MQVFLSWSGPRSRALAEQFNEWLPTVIQTIEPFFSPEDIRSGSRWSDHIAQSLKNCHFGLIFLTETNLEAPWILFEAGALSKLVDNARVCPILFGASKSDVTGPLTQFQLVSFEHDEILKLVKDINQAQETEPIKEDRLVRAFEGLWPNLEKNIAQIPNTAPKKSSRSTADILGEVLDTVRAISQRQERLEETVEDQILNRIRGGTDANRINSQPMLLRVNWANERNHHFSAFAQIRSDKGKLVIPPPLMQMAANVFIGHLEQISDGKANVETYALAGPTVIQFSIESATLSLKEIQFEYLNFYVTDVNVSNLLYVPG